MIGLAGRLIVGLLVLFSAVSANELHLSNRASDRQVCAGVYSKQDWGGSKDTYIELALNIKKGKDDKDGWIAAIVYEYSDVDLIGQTIKGKPSELRKYVCDDKAVNIGLCSRENLGKFIVRDDAQQKAGVPIATERIDVKEPKAMRYNFKKTGFYCVATFPSSRDIEYDGAVVYQNAFGELPASQIAKLPFYGGCALAYTLVFALWMFQYFIHRSDILPVQNYITAICGFLVVEMIVIWGYYDYQNNGAGKTGSMVYLIFVSILNAFRNAFTFFLLLIVCMGYGVVKTSLGDDMWKCKALALAHFVFAVAETVTSYLVDPEKVGPWVMVIILPMALTMTTFYVWILSSLSSTSKFLIARKQHVKALMYKRLTWILLGSLFLMFAFFFINALKISAQSTLEFITTDWKSRWFMLDGCLNIVYFLDFVLIAFLWRPTANNRRFAMSTQIAQDESEAQEFEIASMDGSDDEEERVGFAAQEEEARRRSAEEDQAIIAKLAHLAPKKDQDTPTKASGGEGSSTVFAVHDDDEEDEASKWQIEDDDFIVSDSEGEEAREDQGLKRKDK
ncbi:hypothetical protein TRVA0_055S00298 [Trichomonascus vanleenenianus]|uniref:uncharacterized protein n=1 Tax=Trichomonascus vanleenenianus TaxID=2268995 RepID=UPI003ECAAD05